MKTKTHLLIALCLLLSCSLWAQWTEIYDDFPNSYTVIECPDNMTCYAGGDRLIKTTDGGETWVDASNGITTMNPNWMKCIDKDTCYLWSNVMYKTTDGGQNWVQLTTFPGGLISFINAQIAYVITKELSGQQKVYKTIDYCKTWTEIIHNLPQDGFSAGAGNFIFTSELVGHTIYGDASGTFKQIYKTVDGGVTWVKKFEDNVPFSIQSITVEFPNEQLGYYCGGQQILKTIDGGENWTALTHPYQTVFTQFEDLDFVDENSGYVVGTNSVVMKTTDGGETWIDESPVAGANGSVSVPSMDTAFLATASIYRNSNAGLAKVIDTEGKEIGKIYPNPAQEDFTISLSTVAPNTTLQLFDVSGKLLRTIPLTTSKTEVSRDDLETGTYLYKIMEKNTVLSTGKMLTY